MKLIPLSIAPLSAPLSRLYQRLVHLASHPVFRPPACPSASIRYISGRDVDTDRPASVPNDRVNQRRHAGPIAAVGRYSEMASLHVNLSVGASHLADSPTASYIHKPQAAIRSNRRPARSMSPDETHSSFPIF